MLEPEISCVLQLNQLIILYCLPGHMTVDSSNRRRLHAHDGFVIVPGKRAVNRAGMPGSTEESKYRPVEVARSAKTVFLQATNLNGTN